MDRHGETSIPPYNFVVGGINITLSEQFQNITRSEKFQNITVRTVPKYQSEQFQNITLSEQFQNITLSGEFHNPIDNHRHRGKSILPSTHIYTHSPLNTHIHTLSGLGTGTSIKKGLG
jgi:hypothetical protein